MRRSRTASLNSMGGTVTTKSALVCSRADGERRPALQQHYGIGPLLAVAIWGRARRLSALQQLRRCRAPCRLGRHRVVLGRQTHPRSSRQARALRCCAGRSMRPPSTRPGQALRTTPITAGCANISRPTSRSSTSPASWHAAATTRPRSGEPTLRRKASCLERVRDLCSMTVRTASPLRRRRSRPSTTTLRVATPSTFLREPGTTPEATRQREAINTRSIVVRETGRNQELLDGETGSTSPVAEEREAQPLIVTSKPRAHRNEVPIGAASAPVCSVVRC